MKVESPAKALEGGGPDDPQDVRCQSFLSLNGAKSGAPSLGALLEQVAKEHERQMQELHAYYLARTESLQRKLGEIGEDEGKASIAGVGRSGSASDSSWSPGQENQESKGFVRDPEHRKMNMNLTVSSRKTQSQLEKMQQDVAHVKNFREVFEQYIDMVATVVVALQMVFLIIQMQYGGELIGAEAGFIADWTRNEDYELALKVIDHVFTALFIVEMAARILFLRKIFVVSAQGIVQWYNLIELVLVVANSIDMYLADSSVSFAAFRPLVRFIRLLRVVRMAKLLRFIFKLRVLILTVAASFMALFWSIVLLVTTMLIAALFLNQSLVEKVRSEDIDVERRLWIYERYGTSLQAFYTVFELTFSGGWPGYARPLVEELSPGWAIFFFIYIIIVQFAMFRIITALFLRDTLALAANDAETAVQEKMLQKARVANKLKEFFKVADTSGDGLLSLKEFEEMLELPKVNEWLSLLEIDVRDAKEVFSLLQNDETNASIEDFVQGMMRIKGQAKAQELYELLIQQKRLCQSVSLVSQRIGRMELKLDDATATIAMGI